MSKIDATRVEVLHEFRKTSEISREARTSKRTILIAGLLYGRASDNLAKRSTKGEMDTDFTINRTSYLSPQCLSVADPLWLRRQ